MGAKLTVKCLAVGAAAVAAIGVAAAGVTSVSCGNVVESQVQPVVFSAPLPLDQTGSLPAPGQLTRVLNGLVDPNVPFANKAGLVEGGVGPTEAHLADHALEKADKRGQFPLSFNVSNIEPAGPDSVTADVAVSGPKIVSPVTKNVTFVNQGGWVLSRASAMSLLQAASTA